MAVDTVLFHQFVVCAALDDLPFVHNEGLIRMADGLQPVGNHDNVFLMGQLADGIHQLLLVSGFTLAVASSRIMIGASFIMAAFCRLWADPLQSGLFLLNKSLLR